MGLGFSIDTMVEGQSSWQGTIYSQHYSTSAIAI